MAKREIIRRLEAARADLAAALTGDCWACFELESSMGCKECGGSGIISPADGVYNPGILGTMMCVVVDIVRDLCPETADPDLRAALRWAYEYRIECMLVAFEKDTNELLAVMREAADHTASLTGRRSEFLDGIVDRVGALGPKPTPEQLRNAIRR